MAELVTSQENANTEEGPEIEMIATEEIGEEADLLEEGTDLQGEVDPQEDIEMTHGNIAEEDTIEMTAEIGIEIEITIETDLEITIGEIEGGLDLDPGLFHDPRLRQEESEDLKVEIPSLKKSLKIIQEGRVDARGIPLLIRRIQRTALWTKKKTKKHQILREKRVKPK